VEFFGGARMAVFLKKEWPEKQRQRLEKKRAQWLEDTDCSKGLKKALPAPRPLRKSL
jgi:hypothetical protein